MKKVKTLQEIVFNYVIKRRDDFKEKLAVLTNDILENIYKIIDLYNLQPHELLDKAKQDKNIAFFIVDNPDLLDRLGGNAIENIRFFKPEYVKNNFN